MERFITAGESEGEKEEVKRNKDMKRLIYRRRLIKAFLEMMDSDTINKYIIIVYPDGSWEAEHVIRS